MRRAPGWQGAPDGQQAKKIVVTKCSFYCKINILQRPNPSPVGRRGPLASRGPYARAYRAYRLMRPWAWRKVMAAYRRVYDSRHLQADCQEPGSAPEPYARQSSMGYIYLFYVTNARVCVWQVWTVCRSVARSTRRTAATSPSGDVCSRSPTTRRPTSPCLKTPTCSPAMP